MEEIKKLQNKLDTLIKKVWEKTTSKEREYVKKQIDDILDKIEALKDNNIKVW